MKKNLVILSLLISSIVSVTAPAMAIGLDEAICNIKIIVNNDPRCRDRRPDHRDDRRDHRPPGGYARVDVRDLSPRGEWVTLNFDRSVDLSSVEVRGFGEDVVIGGARVYLRDGGQYDVSARGYVVRLSGREAVRAVDVWVESRPDRRDRRDRWDRRNRVNAEITVTTDSGIPYVRVFRQR